MTPDLDRLESLHAAATKGPWQVYGEPEVGLPPSLFAGIPGEGFDLIEPLRGVDLELVAAMHSALPYLISEIRRMREIEQRMHTARTAVSASPFYTPAQRESALFVLDLIEFNEPRQALTGGTDG